MRHHIARVSNDEHITNIGLCEPRRQHPGVNTGDEDSSRSWVVSDSLELLQHVPLFVCPVLHDPMENLTDAQSSPARHDLKYYSPVISSLC